MKFFLQKKFYVSFTIITLAVIVVLVSIKSNKSINTAFNLQPAKNVERELPKKDRPDLFLKYMHDIKTKFGETNPGYSSNYQIKELLKATNLASTAGLRRLAKTNALKLDPKRSRQCKRENQSNCCRSR